MTRKSHGCCHGLSIGYQLENVVTASKPADTICKRALPRTGIEHGNQTTSHSGISQKVQRRPAVLPP